MSSGGKPAPLLGGYELGAYGMILKPNGRALCLGNHEVVGIDRATARYHAELADYYRAQLDERTAVLHDRVAKKYDAKAKRLGK